MNWKRVLRWGVVVLVALVLLFTIGAGVSHHCARPPEPVSEADLHKIRFEPMEISSIYSLMPTRIYNGTTRPIHELELTVYVRESADQTQGLWAEAKKIGERAEPTTKPVDWQDKYRAEPTTKPVNWWTKYAIGPVDIVKLRSEWRQSTTVPASGTAREYKQGFCRLKSPVPPLSWWEYRHRISESNPTEPRS